jgi:hypothetical protein
MAKRDLMDTLRQMREFALEAGDLARSGSLVAASPINSATRSAWRLNPKL